MSFNQSAYITPDQIVILDTTNASATNASLFVQGGLTTHDTFVDGHVMINNVKITPNLNDIIFEQESILENNIFEWTNIPFFQFDNSISSSFKAYVNVMVSTNISKYALWEINGVYKPTGWIITSSFSGDLTGVNFNIVNESGIGKIQYKNSNLSGTTTIRYRATTTAPPGSTPLSHASGIIQNTSGPFISDRLVYSNTPNTLANTDIKYNSNILTIGGSSRLVLDNASNFVNFSNGGSITSMGDVSIAKNLIVDGKFGINNTNPQFSIDLNGKLNITDNLQFENDKILLTGSISINSTSQHTNTIILNATQSTVNSSTQGSFYVKPIRNDQFDNVLNYNSITSEISYKPYLFAQLFSNESQIIQQDTSTAIIHNSIGESNGISLSNNTEFHFSQIGKFKIGTSILFSESGGSATTARFWFKKNGSDIPVSSSVVYIPGNNTLTLAYAEIIVNISNINDYIEIFTYTSSNNVSIAFSPSSINYPSSPGIITTIYQLN